MIDSRWLLAPALVATVLSPVAAQQPAPAAAAPAQSAAPAQGAAPAAVEAAPPSYSYNREGRRDPFVSLVGRVGDANAEGARPAGLPGILIQEVSLKGIVRQSSGFVAMVQGPDKKTYMARPGQRLFDGSVKSITPDAVVFSQDVTDPLSLVKQREVRKTLRSNEEGQG
jgi:Tfp pilus assembly protein PilP